MPWLLRETDAQLVLLGSGQANWEDTLPSLRGRAIPERVAVRIGFDAALAQRIYAGSDAFLMPSRFEPCGLGQMIALRYGSVPIVRATGGLNDTVREGLEGNGFRFHPYEARYFADAIGRALAAYRNPEGWAMLRERGMREDNSWGHAANVYARLYLAAVKSRGRGRESGDGDGDGHTRAGGYHAASVRGRSFCRKSADDRGGAAAGVCDSRARRGGRP